MGLGVYIYIGHTNTRGVVGMLHWVLVLTAGAVVSWLLAGLSSVF